MRIIYRPFDAMAVETLGTAIPKIPTVVRFVERQRRRGLNDGPPIACGIQPPLRSVVNLDWKLHKPCWGIRPLMSPRYMPSETSSLQLKLLENGVRDHESTSSGTREVICRNSIKRGVKRIVLKTGKSLISLIARNSRRGLGGFRPAPLLAIDEARLCMNTV